MPATKPAEHGVQILDCTIRDGSYVVDYQFTKEDTHVVAHGLAAAGIRHIEVGHGLGLNAGPSGKGFAAITDADYITAACQAVGDKAIIGSFFIPGIGKEDDLRAAAGAGLGFIRLGMDVDEYARLEPFVRLAKSLGLEVWGNMMKSYLLPPAEFAETARRVGEFGVDVVALVDSAGGMTPDDVAAYTEATLARTNTPLAFHGHDNLTLAVANCLRFVECGGLFVDGSLAGLGRSGGNAATELLAALLSQRGKLAWPVDWERLVEFADSVMQFCVPEHARTRATEIATGLNYFHSSFSPVVAKAVAATGAPLFKTILRLPVHSRKKVSEEIALAAATEALACKKADANHAGREIPGAGRLERMQPASLEELVERMRVQKGKCPQRRVVTVAHVPGLDHPRIGPLRKNLGSIVAHLEAGNQATLERIKDALADVCDFWLIDKGLGGVTAGMQGLACCVYDDDQVVAQSLVDAMQMLRASKVFITGEAGGRLEAIKRFALQSGPDERADALVACDSASPAGAPDVERVREGGVVLMLQSGALSADAFARARQRGLAVWRLDCGAALVAEAERLLATHDRFQAGAGSRTLAGGVRIVAGGVVGEAGDIVVDHCQRPRFILGEADGQGGLRPVHGGAAGQAMQQWIIETWNL